MIFHENAAVNCRVMVLQARLLWDTDVISTRNFTPSFKIVSPGLIEVLLSCERLRCRPRNTP